MNTITTTQQLHNTLSWLAKNGHIPNRLFKNLENKIDAGLISVEYTHCDAKKSEWDGELLINFLQPINNMVLINDFIFRCSADEISMNSESQLRLWWD